MQRSLGHDSVVCSRVYIGGVPTATRIRTVTDSQSAPYTVALVQEPPVFLNLAATVSRVEALIAEVASQGARVIVFPETWLPGYPVWIDAAPGAALWDAAGAKALYRLLVHNSVEVGDAWLCRIASAADSHEVVVVIGAHERVGATLYNTMVPVG